MMRRAAPLLLAALMLASLALAGETCIHDKMFNDAHPWGTIEAVRYHYPNEAERPKDEKLEDGLWGSNGYQEMRITGVSHDTRWRGPHCRASGEWMSDMRGDVVECTEEDVLRGDKENIALEMVAGALKLHQDRLRVLQLQKPVKVPKLQSPTCKEFTNNTDDDGELFYNTDFVLYVSLAPMGRGQVMAWGLSCGELHGRPFVGVLHLNPRHLSRSRAAIRSVAHQILHALGFHKSMFEKMGMITTVDNLRGKENVAVVSSFNVMQQTREHYYCSTDIGMELEDQQEGTPIGSHWKRRNAKDELMAAIDGFGFYTAITIAAMEDTGYYRGNYGEAELMPYGRATHCKFLTEKCVDNGKVLSADHFCAPEKSDDLYCTTDRMGFGPCLRQDVGAVDPHFQYFPPKSLGSPADKLMDYCPYVELESRNYTCNAGSLEVLPGSLRGGKSRCIDAVDYIEVEKIRVRGLCANVHLCDPIHRSYRLQFKRLKGSIYCTVGLVYSMKGWGKYYTNGEFVCPNYDSVCPTHDTYEGIEDSTRAAGYTLAALVGSVLLILSTLLN